MILLLDNYDSFVYNLDRYLQQLGQQTLVLRSDAITVDAVFRLGCQAVVISPGPKTPDQAGCSLELIRRASYSLPILGICLGHQAIGQAFGGKTVRSPYPFHGKMSRIHHDGQGIFRGISEPFEAARYHSLMVEESSLPSVLRVTARTEDGLIMGLQHRESLIVGLQFHPESIMTRAGHQLLANFLDMAGLARSKHLPKSEWNPSEVGV